MFRTDKTKIWRRTGSITSGTIRLPIIIMKRSHRKVWWRKHRDLVLVIRIEVKLFKTTKKPFVYLWYAVIFTHQVIYQLIGERMVLGLAHL